MSNLLERKVAYAVTLTSGAKSATGQSDPVTIKDTSAGVVFQCDLTAAATDAGDTLDVTVQTTFDGTNWIDVAYFTQMLGNGGAKRFVAKVSATEPQAHFSAAVALTATNVRHVIGDQWRASWVIVDAGTVNAGFTFSVVAVPI